MAKFVFLHHIYKISSQHPPSWTAYNLKQAVFHCHGLGVICPHQISCWHLLVTVTVQGGFSIRVNVLPSRVGYSPCYKALRLPLTSLHTQQTTHTCSIMQWHPPAFTTTFPYKQPSFRDSVTVTEKKTKITGNDEVYPRLGELGNSKSWM